MSDFQPFTVGDYLRRRRISQGVSVGNPDMELTAEVISAIERDEREPRLAELGELMMTVELDFTMLTAIAVGGQAAIEATQECCRVCACSYADPCQDEEHGPCGWSETADGLCTQCERLGWTVEPGIAA